MSDPRAIAERIQIDAELLGALPPTSGMPESLHAEILGRMRQAAEVLAALRSETRGKYAIDEVPEMRYVTPWEEVTDGP